ncbi:S-methyl-5'-thioinosine phosphorylase [Pseudomarimonas salicorniae]|uniref:Probable S-methyl-5'-thioinosine phosphorylase n=1 Tax=Pseudomarimonas salicorniae TaxID=2933270 RepID=A0ABT0GJN6_9GAMM|nr:S-methyl-5'-thioinosine phosphorylase [Lysobacter sp. CAU 1642]MCK7594225.1 S-methyl-5'-thioinosine phosphorylase [Lysobacter sp. CAU 1642]
MQPIDLAIIGGTGLYRLAGLESPREASLPTPFGHASAPARVGTLAGRRVAFLARHGEGHSVAPHRINYRANLHMLHALGARRVLALNTVGGITPRFAPRALGVPDQIIDYTWGRESTFCDAPGAAVQHAEFAEPYDADLRAALLRAGSDAGVELVEGGCYAATQGPRLETRAEISRLRRDGCDVVGMTGMPEAALARELDLAYACLVIVANWAAGCDPAGRDAAPITMDEVLGNVEAASGLLPALIEALMQQ